MSFATADLCDQHEDRLASGQLRIVAPGLLHLGRRPRFAGEAVTLKVFEDNSLVRTALEEPGRGRVRDAPQLDACELGVRALALHPRRSARRGGGERDVAIQLPGAPVRPGD